jgi:hypothetical protein
MVDLMDMGETLVKKCSERISISVLDEIIEFHRITFDYNLAKEKIEVSDKNMVIKHDGKGQEDITLKRQQLCSHKDIMKG